MALLDTTRFGKLAQVAREVEVASTLDYVTAAARFSANQTPENLGTLLDHAIAIGEARAIREFSNFLADENAPSPTGATLKIIKKVASRDFSGMN